MIPKYDLDQAYLGNVRTTTACTTAESCAQQLEQQLRERMSRKSNALFTGVDITMIRIHRKYFFNIV